MILKKKLKQLDCLINFYFRFNNDGDCMRKQIRYRDFIIKEENGKLNIYKNKKCVSMIHATMNTGYEAAKSKIDKVDSFHFN